MRTLAIGFGGSNPPFSFIDAAGALRGYEVDLAQVLAQRLGRTPHQVQVPWPGSLLAVASGRVDLLLDNVMPTPERSRRLAFSTPTSYSGEQVMIEPRMRQTIRTLADLAGRRVGVAIGTMHEQWLRQQQPRARIESYTNHELALRDLQIGRIDAAVDDGLIIAWLQRRGLPVLAALPAVARAMPAAVVIARGRERLLQQVDAALGTLRADGTLALLGQRWFGFDVSQPGPMP